MEKIEFRNNKKPFLNATTLNELQTNFENAIKDIKGTKVPIFAPPVDTSYYTPDFSKAVKIGTFRGKDLYRIRIKRYSAYFPSSMNARIIKVSGFTQYSNYGDVQANSYMSSSYFETFFCGYWKDSDTDKYIADFSASGGGRTHIGDDIIIDYYLED